MASRCVVPVFLFLRLKHCLYPRLLRAHYSLGTHTQICYAQNYSCPICNRKFSRKDALNRHLMGKREEPGEGASGSGSTLVTTASGAGGGAGGSAAFRETPCAVQYRLLLSCQSDDPTQ